MTENKPLRELIAEAKAEVTEEIEESKEEEEEEDHDAQLVSVPTRPLPYWASDHRKIELEPS